MSNIIQIPTFHNFLHRHGITMKATRVPENPRWKGPQLPKEARHFECRFAQDGKRFSTVFTDTRKDARAPDAETVLGALAVQCRAAALVASGSDELALALTSESEKLREFLGTPAYDELVQKHFN